MLLHDKTHDLKKKLDQSRSQSQQEKEESKKHIDLNIFLQQMLQQVVNENDGLEKEVASLWNSEIKSWNEKSPKWKFLKTI